MNTNLKNITKGLVSGIATMGLLVLMLYVLLGFAAPGTSNLEKRGWLVLVIGILGISVVIAWSGGRAIIKRSIFWWSFLFAFIVTFIFSLFLCVK